MPAPLGIKFETFRWKISMTLHNRIAMEPNMAGKAPNSGSAERPGAPRSNSMKSAVPTISDDSAQLIRHGVFIAAKILGYSVRLIAVISPKRVVDL